MTGHVMEICSHREIYHDNFEKMQEVHRMHRSKIQPGMRYYSLTVLEEVEPLIREVNLESPSLKVSNRRESSKEHRYQKIRMVRCECDCGEERIVSLNALRNGQIRRCKNCVSELHRK